MLTLIKITKGDCEATFSTIGPCLGDVRVTGWISAPTKDRGFEFCGELALELGRKSIGGFCLTDEGPVHFPFEFDVRPDYLPRWGRYETTDELTKRFTAWLKRIQSYHANSDL